MIRLTTLLILVSAIVACDEGTYAPTSPSNPSPAAVSASKSQASIWGMVLGGKSAICVAGAKVKVVKGQRVGQIAYQQTPCDYWGYEGGFYFTNLTPGVAMTLRATAPGYAAVEKTVRPSPGPVSDRVDFSLPRLK